MIEKRENMDTQTYWKFTSTESFKALLKNKTARVCPAIDLNDPGEFKFGVEPYTREKFEMELEDPAIFGVLAPKLTKKYGRTIRNPDTISAKEKEELFSYISRQVDIMKGNARRMPFDLSRLFGVFSCSFVKADEPKGYISPIENPAMWAHYAKHHTGVAYSLNSKFFKNGCQFSSVEYRSSAPTTNASIRFIEQLEPMIGWNMGDNGDYERIVCTKHITWEYESEARALYPLSGADYSSDLNMYFSPIEPTSVGTVIFGCRTAEQDIREIVALAKKDSNFTLDFVKAWELPSSYALQHIPFPTEVQE